MRRCVVSIEKSKHILNCNHETKQTKRIRDIHTESGRKHEHRAATTARISSQNSDSVLVSNKNVETKMFCFYLDSLPINTYL